MAIYTVTLQNVSGDQVVSLSDGSNLAKLQVNPSRGPQGAGWTGVTYNTSTGRFTFTSNDGLGYVSDDITVDLDAAVAAAQAAQTGAEAAEAATELLFDQFGDQYLGPKASDPTVDNDGNPLVEGAVYFNTTDDVLKFYSGTAWVAPESIATNAATAAQASATAAAASETNAAASESAAATSESNAAASASAAAASETNAATSESNAAASASAASTSETNAAASASAASTSETNAAASASAASTSETNAAASASSASTSASNAATSESNAAASASAASTSESNAATSESNAATSAASAAASFDQFDDRYLGAKASDPTLDNDGDPLVTGALYFNTTTDLMKVYNGSSWVDAGSAVNGTAERNVYTATGGQTTFSATYDVGYVDVYLNGVKLVSGTDFTATNGTSIVLASGATAGDTVDIIAYGAFSLANHYTKTEADSRFVNVTGDTMTGGLNVTGGNVGIGTSSPTALLDVVSPGTGAETIAEFGNGNISKGLTIETNGNLDWGFNATNRNLTFSTSQIERMRITSSGSVGIGTSSPDGKLTVSDGLVVIEQSNRFALSKLDTYGNAWSNRSTQPSFIFNGDSTHRPEIDWYRGTRAYPEFSIRQHPSSDAGGQILAGIGTASPGLALDIQTSLLGFYTNNSERARIDASGNLLVGTTSSSSSTAGVKLYPQGTAAFVRSGSQALYANRLSSDGDIAVFAKDGTTVGSIYNGGGNLGVNSSGGLLLVDDIITPTSAADATYDIGRSSARYKNLYLSGGVYLGGTGAANYLDDYETGTWTPTFGAQTNPTNSYTAQEGVYTKTGDLVVARFRITGTYTGGSGSFTYIGGLPFSIGVSGSAASGGLFWGNMSLGSGYTYVVPYNSTTGNIYYIGKSGSGVASSNVALSEFGGGFDLQGVLIYRAS